MTHLLPKPLKSGANAEGLFGKQDFIYSAAEDEYRCPAGQRLTWRFTNVEHGLTLRHYWTGVQRIRRQTVEHPFGTLKAWMGATHFLTRP
jgi:transposase